MWVAFAFILLASKAAHGQQHCIPGAFTACDPTLSREEKNKARDVGLTPTEEELREICPSLQRNKNCMVEEIEKCGEAETAEHEGFVEFIKGSKAVLDELCDEGSTLHASKLLTDSKFISF
ncbi:uncharacterized protein LOC118186850, partial [Stegodyphus dumicola]|uniref:uncharacterized protein LOC118186850 n=1 Tax=Stegodyphus dumicola TaxID=202533 RepID=UPI0015B2D617